MQLHALTYSLTQCRPHAAISFKVIGARFMSKMGAWKSVLVGLIYSFHVFLVCCNVGYTPKSIKIYSEKSPIRNCYSKSAAHADYIYRLYIDRKSALKRIIA